MSEHVIEFVSTSGCTVRIHRPDISDEERGRRMEKFKKATACFMKAVYKNGTIGVVNHGR